MSKSIASRLGNIKTRKGKFGGRIVLFMHRIKEAKGMVFFDLKGSRMVLTATGPQEFPATFVCDPAVEGVFVNHLTYPDPNSDYVFLLEYEGDCCQPLIRNSSPFLFHCPMAPLAKLP